MLRIHNPRGPHQSPKITKNTPNIDAFTLAPLEHYKNHALAAINFYQSPASSNLIHIQGRRAARPWPQSPKSQKIIPKIWAFFPAPLKNVEIMLRQPQILPRTQCFTSSNLSYIQGGHTIHRDPRGPHQRPKLTKNITKIDSLPLPPFKRENKNWMSLSYE